MATEAPARADGGERLLLSVVVPVYGSAPMLGELAERLVKALDAITPRWEVIFVDDASPDEAWEVLEELAAGEPRLRALHWLITAAFVLNLYLFYGLGMTLPPVIDRRWTFIDMSVLLSVAYLALAIWLTFETRALTTSNATTRGSSRRQSRRPQSHARGRSSGRRPADR